MNALNGKSAVIKSSAVKVTILQGPLFFDDNIVKFLVVDDDGNLYYKQHFEIVLVID